MYVKELDIFLTMKVLEFSPAVLSLGKLFDENGFSYEWINGQENHISLKTGFGYNTTRRTSFLSWFQACQRVRPRVLISQLQGHFQDRDWHCSTSSSSSCSSVKSTFSNTENHDKNGYEKL